MIMLEGRRRPNNSGERGTSRDNRSDHARRTAILDCRAAINWGATAQFLCSEILLARRYYSGYYAAILRSLRWLHYLGISARPAEATDCTKACRRGISKR